MCYTFMTTKGFFLPSSFYLGWKHYTNVSQIHKIKAEKGGIKYYAASRNTVINIRSTGSPSYRYLDTGVIFLLFSKGRIIRQFRNLKNTKLKHYVQVLEALHILMDIEEDTILQSWASLWGIHMWAVCLWIPPLPSQWNSQKVKTWRALEKPGCAVTPWKGPPMLLYMDQFSCRPPLVHKIVGPCLSLGDIQNEFPSKASAQTKSSLQVPCHSCLCKPFCKYKQ